MNLKIRLLGVSIFLIIATPLIAAGVDTGGTIFLGGEYVAQPEDDSGYNAFDVSRVYLTVKDSLPQRENGKFKAAYKATVDLKRRDDGHLVRVLKYGYVELTHVSTGVKLQLGQHAVPWAVFAGKIFNFRFVTKSFSHRVKMLSTADKGLSALYSLPQGYGDIHVSVVNGEGWSKPELNKYKDLMGRLSIRPLPGDEKLKGLRAHVYYGLGTVEEGVVRNRLVGAASYEGKSLAVLAEYLGSWDGDSDDSTAGAGFGGSVSFDLGKFMGKGSHGVFGKVEQFDPNTDVDDDAHLRILAGIFCEVTKGLKFALGYDTRTYEGDKDSDGAISLHTQVKF